MTSRSTSLNRSLYLIASPWSRPTSRSRRSTRLGISFDSLRDPHGMVKPENGGEALAVARRRRILECLGKQGPVPIPPRCVGTTVEALTQEERRMRLFFDIEVVLKGLFQGHQRLGTQDGEANERGSRSSSSRRISRGVGRTWSRSGIARRSSSGVGRRNEKRPRDRSSSRGFGMQRQRIP